MYQEYVVIIMLILMLISAIKFNRLAKKVRDLHKHIARLEVMIGVKEMQNILEKMQEELISNLKENAKRDSIKKEGDGKDKHKNKTRPA